MLPQDPLGGRQAEPSPSPRRRRVKDCCFCRRPGVLRHTVVATEVIWCARLRLPWSASRILGAQAGRRAWLEGWERGAFRAGGERMDAAAAPATLAETLRRGAGLLRW